MKTVTAIIILVVILVGGYFVIRMADNVDRTDTTDRGQVRDPDNVAFRVGDTKDVAGFSITLNKISEDSRCPFDVQCVWAGRFTTSVTIRSGEKMMTMDLSSEGPVMFDDYKLYILHVSPEPISTLKIEESDYIVTIHVISTAAEDMLKSADY